MELALTAFTAIMSMINFSLNMRIIGINNNSINWYNILSNIEVDIVSIEFTISCNNI